MCTLFRQDSRVQVCVSLMFCGLCISLLIESGVRASWPLPLGLAAGEAEGWCRACHVFMLSVTRRRVRAGVSLVIDRMIAVPHVQYRMFGLNTISDTIYLVTSLVK